ncbi:hypothetical protein [Sorangium sp. So ce131]|uniref:hypothetical protein n=1 Tax=Sorangium sp. So ce131 TaxID=3133282 RepID=UPI003F5EB2C2
MTEAQQWFEQFMQSLRDEARREVLEERIKEGEISVIARQFERKLGRSLAEVEHAVLAERFDRLGLDRLDDVRLELSADALAAWLTDPAAR